MANECLHSWMFLTYNSHGFAVCILDSKDLSCSELPHSSIFYWGVDKKLTNPIVTISLKLWERTYKPLKRLHLKTCNWSIPKLLNYHFYDIRYNSFWTVILRNSIVLFYHIKWYQHFTTIFFVWYIIFRDLLLVYYIHQFRNQNVLSWIDFATYNNMLLITLTADNLPYGSSPPQNAKIK